MAHELDGKVVLITGAANGIGACVVRFLLQENVKHVAILDIAEEAGTTLERELNKKFDNKVKFIKCDVTEENQLYAAFQEVTDKLGYIDAVVNNAGIMNDGLKMYRKEIDVNLTSLVASTLKALQLMRKDEGGVGGTVINISSVAGLCQIPDMPIYWATKSAVIQFSNCIGLNQYYSRTGVRVLTICFGATDTSLMSAGRLDSFDKELGKRLLQIPKQRIESAARGVLEVYKRGDSGSTWLVARDEPAVDITSTIKAAYGIMSEHVFKYVKK